MNNENVPFKQDEKLEATRLFSAKRCFDAFVEKGGRLQSIHHPSEATAPLIQLNEGDIVYPVCSGGLCRSQTLWALLSSFTDKITLIPPHAARFGWDPYDGNIYRSLNYLHEIMPDEFSLCFGMEKALRFGFENHEEWLSIEESSSSEGLKKISGFYDLYYFSPPQGKGRRVYITFSRNAHVVLHRLNQTNESLNNVLVIFIDIEDIITTPPEFLHTTPRSVKAYQHFSNIISKLLGCVPKL